jgi:hypothetical protein
VHPLPRGLQIAGGDGSALFADTVYGDDPAIFSEKPEEAGIEFAYVPQFEQSVAKSSGQRLPMVLTAAEFCQTGDDRSKIVRIASLQGVKKLPYGAGPRFCFIKLYRKIHDRSTSFLMYLSERGNLFVSRPFAALTRERRVERRRTISAPL